MNGVTILLVQFGNSLSSNPHVVTYPQVPSLKRFVPFFDYMFWHLALSSPWNLLGFPDFIFLVFIHLTVPWVQVPIPWECSINIYNQWWNHTYSFCFFPWTGHYKVFLLGYSAMLNGILEYVLMLWSRTWWHEIRFRNKIQKKWELVGT